MNRTLARHGFPVHPFGAYRLFIGDGVEMLAERALPPHAGGLRDQVVLEYRADYAKNLLQHTRLYPGMAACLDGLVERRVKLGILSNKLDGPTREIASALLGRWPFLAVFGERIGIPRKPDPRSALEVARMLGVAPAGCTFVGDTSIDMLTAVAAGMVPVGVSWGFRPAALQEAGAVAVLEHPEALLSRF